MRKSEVIEADWCSDTDTIKDIVEKLDKAGKIAGIGYRVIPFRDCGAVKVFLAQHWGNNLFPLELTICKHSNITSYSTQNKKAFIGATPYKIMADTIVGLSNYKKYYGVWNSKALERMCNEFYDLYILSRISGYRLLGIFESMQGKRIGNFKEFNGLKAQLKEQYNKMTSIKSKLDFELVYNRVTKFLEPFQTQNIKNLTWNGNEWVNNI